uniref:Uncharacterized protein n=1 Tax=Anguilla anguilla TaxID=7936 RepID=A0A0E9U892_ANGAN
MKMIWLHISVCFQLLKTGLSIQYNFKLFKKQLFQAAVFEIVK